MQSLRAVSGDIAAAAVPSRPHSGTVETGAEPEIN